MKKLANALNRIKNISRARTLGVQLAGAAARTRGVSAPLMEGVTQNSRRSSSGGVPPQ